MSETKQMTIRLTLSHSEAGPGWPEESHSMALDVDLQKDDAEKETGRLLAQIAKCGYYPPNGGLSSIVDAFIEELEELGGCDNFCNAYYAVRKAIDRWGNAGYREADMERLVKIIEGFQPKRKTAQPTE
jgi:hypothetical protein